MAFTFCLVIVNNGPPDPFDPTPDFSMFTNKWLVDITASKLVSIVPYGIMKCPRAHNNIQKQQQIVAHTLLIHTMCCSVLYVWCGPLGPISRQTSADHTSNTTLKKNVVDFLSNQQFISNPKVVHVK